MEVQVVIAFIARLVVGRLGDVGLPFHDGGAQGVPPAQVVMTARGRGAMLAPEVGPLFTPGLLRPLPQHATRGLANPPEGALVVLAEAAAKPVRARPHSHAVHTGRKRQKLRQPRGISVVARVQLDQRRVQGPCGGASVAREASSQSAKHM